MSENITAGWKIRSEWIDKVNPEMPAGSDAWKVVVTNPRGQRLQRQYFKGPGHRGAEPTLDEFMGCMVSDAGCVEWCDSPEEFADNLGYEMETPEDVRKVTRIYNACKAIAAKMETFVTDEEREYFRDK